MTGPNELGEMAKSFLSKREDVIRALLKDIEQCEVQSNGCARVMENWDKVKENPDNMEKQLQTALKCVGKLSEMNKRLVMLTLVHVMGNNFQTDAAVLMNKLSMGQEALQEMFRQKMRGK